MTAAELITKLEGVRKTASGYEALCPVHGDTRPSLSVSQGRAGKVLVPPSEYDPATGDATSDDFVAVGPGGVVKSWTWVAQPRAKQPLQHPFAYALIQLDGADTALLHAVDAGSESRMRTGLRVRPRWRAERKGEIADLACFEPEA